MGSTLHRLLKSAWENRKNPAEPHVLLTPRSAHPIEQPRLSRIVRTALIRSGLENVPLGDLCRVEKRTDEDTRLLAYAMGKGAISRTEVMELPGVSKAAAYERLRRLAGAGELVRVGGKYYPAWAGGAARGTLRCHLRVSGGKRHRLPAGPGKTAAGRGLHARGSPHELYYLLRHLRGGMRTIPAGSTVLGPRESNFQ